MTEDGAYRTDDLALATILALAGYEYRLQKLSQQKAIWVFGCSSEEEEEFDDLVDAYNGFVAKVEPRAFVARWGEMRGELYRLVPPKRRPGAPATATT